jgi:hypothetical protein
VRRAGVRHPVLDRGRGRLERHGVEGVGQRLLVPTCAESGVPYWGRGGLLVQRLLLLLLWPGQEVGRRVEARCGHEGLRTLLSSGHGAGVHSHVPLARVVVGRRRCVGPTVETSGGSGLARRATTASTAVAVLVIVLVPVATDAVVSTIGRARRHGRRWLSRRGRSVGVECRRGSQRPGTVHVNLLQ